MMGQTDTNEPPAWFADAITVLPSTARVRVEGAEVLYRVWGQPGPSPLILVHGGAANSRWWDHVAPLLADGRQVAALDLSGHGKSDHRDRYSRDLWVEEVLAVARALQAESGTPAILVGHSMGGMVVLAAAMRTDSDLAGVVVIDSPIRFTLPRPDRERARRAARQPRYYETEDELIARFRPDPMDGPCPEYLRHHLAVRSILRTPNGFRWQFDPRFAEGGGMCLEEIGPLRCPAALIRGERGMFTAEASAEAAARIGACTLESTVANSGHHIMLEEPLALIAHINAACRHCRASSASPVSTAVDAGVVASSHEKHRTSS